MRRAPLGLRLLGALTAHVRASRALAGIAILAALAVGLLLSSVGPLQAQEAFDYPENGTAAPWRRSRRQTRRGRTLTWRSEWNRRWRFQDRRRRARHSARKPNFERLQCRRLAMDSNTYTVTVVASAGAGDAAVQMDEHEVTVNVTNVDEAWLDHAFDAAAAGRGAGGPPRFLTRTSLTTTLAIRASSGSGTGAPTRSRARLRLTSRHLPGT